MKFINNPMAVEIVTLEKRLWCSVYSSSVRSGDKTAVAAENADKAVEDFRERNDQGGA